VCPCGLQCFRSARLDKGDRLLHRAWRSTVFFTVLRTTRPGVLSRRCLCDSRGLLRMLRDAIEPDFYMVGRRKVHMDSSSCGEPTRYAKLLARSVVLHHDVHRLEELWDENPVPGIVGAKGRRDPLLSPVARLSLRCTRQNGAQPREKRTRVRQAL